MVRRAHAGIMFIRDTSWCVRACVRAFLVVRYSFGFGETTTYGADYASSFIALVLAAAVASFFTWLHITTLAFAITANASYFDINNSTQQCLSLARACVGLLSD